MNICSQHQKQLHPTKNLYGTCILTTEIETPVSPNMLLSHAIITLHK